LSDDPVKLEGRWRVLGSALAWMLAASLLLAACGRGRGKGREIAYVSAPQAVLRDRVAQVYTKVGVVKNGDRLEVLGRESRFAHVRAADGSEGWVEQRHLVSQQIYDAFQKLAQDHQAGPVQAPGTTRNDTNFHLTPGRDTEHLYQVAEGAKLSILKRATVEKILPGAAPKPSSDQKKEAPKPAMEDWWLVRDAQGRAGWVLARMVDLDAPLEVAQYAEGQRIVAFFVLDEVQDGDKRVPQYLVALTEPKDGMPSDFNQVRVFTWNVKRHRYETAYRERNLNGFLPVTVGHENFDKEGDLPIFVLRVQGDDGSLLERKYKLNTPIVRRVLAPGEQPAKPAARKKR
jgi:SH3-like domain-containing protein